MKFNIIYENLMNSLNTIRKGIRKVNQMNNVEFLRFLRQIIPLFKNGKLDLSKVKITQKIDGNATRFVWINNDLKFEQSRGGLRSYKEMSFADQYEWIYKHFKTKFAQISKQFKTDFKIIGELIWCEGMIEKGKITPVGASYLADKFGTKGGMVIFDLKKIENNSLIDFDSIQNEKILNAIINLSNEEFNFYDSNDITLTDVEFTLDVQKLTKLLSLPEYNKEKYNIKTDKAIIDSIQQLKDDITTQLEIIINNTKGVFSEPGDMIEGMVIKINDSGNQYGMFSEGYKAKKLEYSKYRDIAEGYTEDFYKNVFNVNKISQIRKLQNLESYQNKFNQYFKDYLDKLGKLIYQLKNDESIPLGTKIAQETLMKNRLQKLYLVQNYKDFLKIIIKNENENE